MDAIGSFTFATNQSGWTLAPATRSPRPLKRLFCGYTRGTRVITSLWTFQARKNLSGTRFEYVSQLYMLANARVQRADVEAAK
jgi:hypothetical protein